MRHGLGELGLKNGNIVKGSFVNNHPEGLCTISYTDGSQYVGNLVRGVPEGEGTLKKEGFQYTGTFHNGVRDGKGVLTIPESTFSLESTFENNKPSYECNKMTCEIISPKIEEPVVDPKAKPSKDAPKPVSKFTEQEDAKYGALKIYYEYKRSVKSTTEDTDDIPGILPEIQVKF